MFFLFLLGCILLILQTATFCHLPLWVLKIDGLSLLVIYISLYLNRFQGLLVIFSLGLLVDTFAGSGLGMHVLIYVLIFALVRFFVRTLVVKNIYHQIALVFAISLSLYLGLLVLDSVFRDGVILWRSVMAGFLQSLFMSLLSPLFFTFYKYLGRLFGLREVWEVSSQT